ncbi:MAG TPA: hypothetical protein VIT67_01150 [Povalibacter sp.]
MSCHFASFSQPACAFILYSLNAGGLALAAVPARGETSIPTITVASIDVQASEVGPKSATLLFTREASVVDKPLTIPFALTGTATAGIDYVSPGTSVTFTANSPLAMLTITPIRDAFVEGQETIVLTLAARPGAYIFGEEKSATITIADASAGSGSVKSHSGTPPVIVDPVHPASTVPAPDRTGSLVVSIAFDGTGTWKHPRNGAYSNTKFHREISYTVPLSGMYSAGSGFTEIDRRAQMMPDLERYLIGQPRDVMAVAGTPCGRGTVTVLDTSSGMEVGDPGQPPLVPFNQQVKGGGAYPSGDKTVPERNLCLTRVSFDNEQHKLHLRLDGTDTHVKVINTHNGHQMPAYNLRLQGDASDAKSKFTFFDLPIPSGAMSSSGSKTLQEISTVTGPMNTRYPLTATVKWQVTMK